MSKVKVMLTDDHQIVRDGIKAMIASDPSIQIIGEASNHRELFAALEHLRPDVLVLDISMPEMTGIEIAAALHDERPEIKILMLSMYEGEDFIVNAIESGVKGYLPKTATQKELCCAIAAIHAGNDYFSDSVSSILLKSFIKKTQTKAKPEDKEVVQLTRRELEILKLFAEGLANKEIADKLFISIRTVESHKNNIMQKLDLKSTVELVKYAIKHKLVEL